MQRLQTEPVGLKARLLFCSVHPSVAERQKTAFGFSDGAKGRWSPLPLSCGIDYVGLENIYILYLYIWKCGWVKQERAHTCRKKMPFHEFFISIHLFFKLLLV